MSGFAEEFLQEGASENFLSPPTPGVTPNTVPFTRSNNFILRQTLAARDETIAIQASLSQILIDIQTGVAASDIASLPARP